MSKGREGYILLATERQKYFDMACNLARSIRVFDPSRPIALIVDPSIATGAHGGIFDEIVVMPPKAGYVGVMNKLRLFDANPFDRALFIDSDCLMARPGISAYWESFDEGCNTLGRIITDGDWKGLDIPKVIETLGLKHLVMMNAGIVFFDKSELSKNIFAYMEELVELIPKGITVVHQKREGQYSMEPILGAALAKFGMQPMKILPRIGSLMVSTLYARHVRIDPKLGVSYLEKPDKSSFRAYFPLSGAKWTSHSPILIHFIGLRPADVYASANAVFSDMVLSGKTV
jgi:hypothetical protein